MSTRSQLRFVQRGDQDDEPNDSDRVAQVYRRSDGYPTSVLQDLIRLKELLGCDPRRERTGLHGSSVRVPRQALEAPPTRPSSEPLGSSTALEHALEELVAKPA